MPSNPKVLTYDRQGASRLFQIVRTGWLGQKSYVVGVVGIWDTFFPEKCTETLNVDMILLNSVKTLRQTRGS